MYSFINKTKFFSSCEFWFIEWDFFLKQCNLAIYVSHLCAKNDFNDSKIVLLLSWYQWYNSQNHQTLHVELLVQYSSCLDNIQIYSGPFMLYLKKKTLVKDNELYASIHLHFSTIYTLKCMCIYIMYDYLKRVLKIRVKNVSIFILSDYKLLKYHVNASIIACINLWH